MYTRKLTYTDFDGVERTETFRFNLTKAEIAELELSTEGGLQNHLQNIIDSKSQTDLIRNFKKILLLAYGEKSPDGRRFDKSEEISAKFASTQAYSDLFMEFATNSESALNFVKQILPPDMVSASNATEGVTQLHA